MTSVRTDEGAIGHELPTDLAAATMRTHCASHWTWRLLAAFGALGLTWFALGLVQVMVGSDSAALTKQEAAVFVGRDGLNGATAFSCDALNVPKNERCVSPGMVCQRCDQNPTGLTLVNGMGFIQSGVWNCGNLQEGTCDNSLTCVGPWTALGKCNNPVKVIAQ